MDASYMRRCGMPTNKGMMHQYGQAVVAVILAALLTAIVHKVGVIEDSILHKDYVEQRFTHIEYMINELKGRGND